jgi:glycosyltransferase involved in cell wall biosynthesis
MRIAMVLPGLHRVTRGAEVAFEAIADQLGQRPDVELTLFGSGHARAGQPYNFQHVPNLPRENFEQWPKFPILRTEFAYEELTFLPGLIQCYRPEQFDLTVTCSYPFLNWFLRGRGGKQRPAHVFVTQNSDYPAIANRREYRFFGCDGLVCLNQEYYQRNQDRWFSKLIPNGVDIERFSPGPVDRSRFGLPQENPIALMVSALSKSKRVVEGIRAAAEIADLHLVVCGDGPAREAVKETAIALMPGRFHLLKLSYEQMPDIYRAADVFMHMCLNEPFGMVYLESLSTGLPIVSHNQPVTEWILEDKAILVDTTDTAKVAHGIREALNSNSVEKAESRRSLALERFSWPKIEQQYYEFFQAAIEHSDLIKSKSS